MYKMEFLDHQEAKKFERRKWKVDTGHPVKYIIQIYDYCSDLSCSACFDIFVPEAPRYITGTIIIDKLDRAKSLKQMLQEVMQKVRG